MHTGIKQEGCGRVFIMGMDGATFDLINPWLEEGLLPNFSALIRDGASGRLDPAANMRSAASWTSFATGKNPGKHGIYEFYEFLPATYGIKFINGGDNAAATMWRRADLGGRRTIVINVPMSFPAEQLENGMLISGLDAPGTASAGFCHPASLLPELEKKFGPYIIEPGLTGFIIDGKLDQAVDKLFEEIEQKRKITLHLMDKHPWSLFVSVFRSLDAAQHCFWRFMDPGHPYHDPALREKYGDVILNTYRKLDAVLGEIRDRLAPEDTLLLMSDHGFGAKHPANNQLNTWLASRGYLAYLPEESRGAVKKALTGLLQKTYVFLAGKLPRRYKEVFARLLPAVRNRVHSQLCFTGIDWSRTTAYSDTLFANIRINLRGREGKGIVRPGEEHRSLVNRIKDDLFACRDAQSGKPIVERVLFNEDIYQGPFSGRAPDLTIHWREDLRISGIKMDVPPRPGSWPGDHPLIPAEDARVISGDHRRFGVFFALGPGIKKGIRLDGAHIMDLAPTSLYLLNLPVPSDLDGKVLKTMFTEEALRARPVETQKTDAAQAGFQPRADYDEDEKKAIEKRLRDLGYLE